MQAVIYTRVSSDEQVKGMSLTFQREDCLRYAKERRIEVVKTFEERGESAKFANRPELVKLLAYCRSNQRQLDALIVWKLDRLSRNQMDYYFIKRTLHGYGIALHSATEPTLEDSTSIVAKVFETFSALQAEIDNTIRRERAMRGMAARIETGIYPWQPPLGYQSGHNRKQGLKKTDADKPDQDRFALVQKLFRTCLDERICGNVELARRANIWGLRSLTGKKIYPQMVARMLSNKFYAGVLVNPWTGEEHHGKHVPIISPDEFAIIQARREGRIASQPAVHRSEHPDFPLRKTVKCGHCRAPLTGSWSRGNGGRYAYYHCANKRCHHYGKGLRKNSLEDAFMAKLRALTPKQDIVQVLAAALVDLWTDKQHGLEGQRKRHMKRIQELESRWHGLVAMKERDLLSDEEFLDRKECLQAELATAKVTLATLQNPKVMLNSSVTYLVSFVENLPQWWCDQNPRRKRRFQKFLLPTGIPYRREKGFGTATLSPIYEVFRESRGSKSRLVRLAGENWNQIIDELEKLRELLEEDEDESI